MAFIWREIISERDRHILANRNISCILFDLFNKFALSILPFQISEVLHLNPIYKVARNNPEIGRAQKSLRFILKPGASGRMFQYLGSDIEFFDSVDLSAPAIK